MTYSVSRTGSCSPAAWKGINPEFADKYQIPQIVWAATTTAAVATAGPGGTATIVFPQPTSTNAPFTYAVSQTDTTTGTTGAAALSGQPVVDAEGNVTVAVTGLTVGNVYTFTPSVDTPYAGITATGLPTAAITAAA